MQGFRSGQWEASRFVVNLGTFDFTIGVENMNNDLTIDYMPRGKKSG